MNTFRVVALVVLPIVIACGGYAESCGLSAEPCCAAPAAPCAEWTTCRANSFANRDMCTPCGRPGQWTCEGANPCLAQYEVAYDADRGVLVCIDPAALRAAQ